MNNNIRTYLYQGGRPDSSEGEGITHVIVKDGVLAIDNNRPRRPKQQIH